MKTYQIYNASAGKVHYETEDVDLLFKWLKMNTVGFLAQDRGYFPAAGQEYRVIEKETDFDVTDEIIELFEKKVKY